MNRLLRLLALTALIFCVHCKMIDLDCALHNPLHCQTLLESDDNTFGHVCFEQPLWTDPPVLIVELVPVPVVRVAPCPPQPELPQPQGATPEQPQQGRRPPPFLT